jgi:hypothetical protein
MTKQLFDEKTYKKIGKTKAQLRREEKAKRMKGVSNVISDILLDEKLLYALKKGKREVKLYGGGYFSSGGFDGIDNSYSYSLVLNGLGIKYNSTYDGFGYSHKEGQVYLNPRGIPFIKLSVKYRGVSKTRRPDKLINVLSKINCPQVKEISGESILNNLKEGLEGIFKD